MSCAVSARPLRSRRRPPLAGHVVAEDPAFGLVERDGAELHWRHCCREGRSLPPPAESSFREPLQGADSLPYIRRSSPCPSSTATASRSTTRSTARVIRIILSHGYSATSKMWEKQVQALAGSYRVITWDMRGHGLSDSPDDLARYSEEATVGDMAALLDVDRRAHRDRRRPVARRLHVARVQRAPARARARAPPVRHRAGIQERHRARRLEQERRSAGAGARDAGPRRARRAQPRGGSRISIARPRVWRSPRAACWRSATIA